MGGGDFDLAVEVGGDEGGVDVADGRDEEGGGVGEGGEDLRADGELVRRVSGLVRLRNAHARTWERDRHYWRGKGSGSGAGKVLKNMFFFSLFCFQFEYAIVAIGWDFARVGFARAPQRNSKRN